MHNSKTLLPGGKNRHNRAVGLKNAETHKRAIWMQLNRTAGILNKLFSYIRNAIIKNTYQALISAVSLINFAYMKPAAWLRLICQLMKAIIAKWCWLRCSSVYSPSPSQFPLRKANWFAPNCALEREYIYMRSLGLPNRHLWCLHCKEEAEISYFWWKYYRRFEIQASASLLFF